MLKRYKVLILSIVLLIFSCNKEENKTKLAQVYNKVLYFEDIQDIIPKNISPEDSIVILKNRIDFWVKKQTILKRAELNLTEKQKDISSTVEDYRASLLIEKYKQEIIKKEIDTTISEQEIENYYNQFPESFKLNEEVVKALLFKFSVESSNINSFKNAFYLNNEEKMIALAEKKAKNIENFNNKWTQISTVLNFLPNNFNNPETILKASKKLQTRDTSFLYYVIFKDFKLKGETEPLELAKDRIKIILLNKRKRNIIRELEKRIYQSDIKNNSIKIFLKNN